MSATKIYSAMLYCYPKRYRQRYGVEMRRVFSEMYRDQDKAGLLFWMKIASDMLVSGAQQHIEDLSEKGPKNYLGNTLGINMLNIIGGVLLLPFMILLGIDFIGRVVQLDFVHYNRSFYAVVSNSVLYKNTWLLWIIVVLAPILAALLNLLSFLNALSKNKGKLNFKGVLFVSPLSLLLIVVGIFAFSLIHYHDFIPCLVHGLLIKGPGDIGEVISVCKKV